MITLRKAKDRFHTRIGWLDSWHTFSFGDHSDPRFDGFRALRVINDDTVTPRAGFPTHGHRDMDIISYVIDGALGHKDSMGNGSVIEPGDVQRMTAGTGVRHSEMNASDAPTHFLQIWIIPDHEGLPPSYEQRTFPDAEKRDRLRLVASGTPRDGAVKLHEDCDLYATRLSQHARVEHPLREGRGAWVHVVKGDVDVNGARLTTGDGAALEDEAKIAIAAHADSEVLLFDLA